MKYITKAGVKFISEARKKIPKGLSQSMSQAYKENKAERERMEGVARRTGVVLAEPGSGGIGSSLPPGVLNPKPKPKVKLQKR